MRKRWSGSGVKHELPRRSIMPIYFIGCRFYTATEEEGNPQAL